MKHQDLTAQIIECAHIVHDTFQFGFREAIYQNALLIELLKAGLQAEKEKKIQANSDSRLVGDRMPGIIVENKVILKLKSLKNLHPVHETQLFKYQRATGIEIGILINFGESVEIRCKVFTPPKEYVPLQSGSPHLKAKRKPV